MYVCVCVCLYGFSSFAYVTNQMTIFFTFTSDCLRLDSGVIQRLFNRVFSDSRLQFFWLNGNLICRQIQNNRNDVVSLHIAHFSSFSIHRIRTSINISHFQIAKSAIQLLFACVCAIANHVQKLLIHSLPVLFALHFDL